MSTPLEVLMELQERTMKAVAELVNLQDAAHGARVATRRMTGRERDDAVEVAIDNMSRLRAKESGVRLVLSYITEAIKGIT